MPPDLFATHLKEAERLIDSFSLATPEGQVVRRLLDVLIDEGEHLSGRSAQLLVQTTLEAVAESIRASHVELPQRMGLVDRRLHDIEKYILMNLTDPDLCYDKVAACCGISPRYLCYLLKARNTSRAPALRSSLTRGGPAPNCAGTPWRSGGARRAAGAGGPCPGSARGAPRP